MAKNKKIDKTGKKRRKGSVQPAETTIDLTTAGSVATHIADTAELESVISPRRRQRAGEAVPPGAVPTLAGAVPLAPAAATMAGTSTAPTTALITGLTALANRSSLVVDSKVRAAGLRTAELSVYALLAVGESLTPRQIAEATGLAATTVSSLLRRAEERGDVARVPNPRDARSALMELSDSGRFRYTEALVYLDPLVRDLKQAGVPTGTQVMSALGVLRRWVDAMEPNDSRA